MLSRSPQNGGQLNTVMQLFGQNKKLGEPLTKQRGKMELRRKLDEPSGIRLRYKMARERDEDRKDLSWIGNQTDKKNALRIIVVQRETSCELELPNAVEGEMKLEEIVYTEEESTMKKTKKGRAMCIDEFRVETLMMAERGGVSWTSRLLYTCIRGGVPR